MNGICVVLEGFHDRPIAETAAIWCICSHATASKSIVLTTAALFRVCGGVESFFLEATIYLKTKNAPHRCGSGDDNRRNGHIFDRQFCDPSHGEAH